jgi:hypothetical protein
VAGWLAPSGQPLSSHWAGNSGPQAACGS